MWQTQPTITDLERGGAFLVLVLGGAWLAKQALKFVNAQAAASKEANDKQIEMMAKQINDGREQVDKLIAAFQRSLDLHEAEKKGESAVKSRRRK